MGSERFLRPESVVLGDASIVPPDNQVRPSPNRFTHEVIKAEPFYFGREADSKSPDGQLGAGAKVILLRDDGGARCRVVDGRGLYVEISCSSLRHLT